MIAFLKNLIGMHGQNAMRSMTDQVVSLDPATASAAQLKTMEQDLDKVGREVGKLRIEAQRERQEAVDAQKNYDRLLAAGHNLNQKLQAEMDPTRRQQLEAALGKLVGELERAQEAVNVEGGEADEAEALLTELEAAYKEKAEAIRQAQHDLKRAAGDMRRAEISKERADARAESAARVAGLRTHDTGGLNAALVSMQRKTADARAAAEASRMKTQALSAPGNTAEEDPDIKAALAATSGTALLGDASSRFAALAGPKTAPAAALPAPAARLEDLTRQRAEQTDLA